MAGRKARALSGSVAPETAIESSIESQEGHDAAPPTIKRLGLLRELFRVVERVAVELGTEHEPHEWIDQYHSPLGVRGHLEAVRSGKLRGFKPDRKRVLVSREDIDAFIRRHPVKAHALPAKCETPNVNAEYAAAQLRARLGLVRT